MGYKAGIKRTESEPYFLLLGMDVWSVGANYPLTNSDKNSNLEISSFLLINVATVLVPAFQAN